MLLAGGGGYRYPLGPQLLEPHQFFVKARVHASAKKVFAELWTGSSDDVNAVIERLGLKQMNDTGALEEIIDEVIAANADNVAQFKAGKDKAFNALVGQIMKASKGKANPQQVNDLLRKKLAGS